MFSLLPTEHGIVSFNRAHLCQNQRSSIGVMAVIARFHKEYDSPSTQVLEGKSILDLACWVWRETWSVYGRMEIDNDGDLWTKEGITKIFDLKDTNILY